MTMDHLFAVDEVIRLGDEFHERGQSLGPVVQYSIHIILRGRRELEVDDTI